MEAINEQNIIFTSVNYILISTYSKRYNTTPIHHKKAAIPRSV
jgi:hypothetical protein